MVLQFIYLYADLQQAVKQETSLLAERRRQEMKDGRERELFDELVMDEEYDTLFKRLFDDATAEVVLRMPAHNLADTDTDLGLGVPGSPSFNNDLDWALWLKLHDGFPMQYKRSIEIKIRAFLTDYICYRWFETKSPADAATYFARLDITIEDVQRMLVRTSHPIKRLPNFP